MRGMKSTHDSHVRKWRSVMLSRARNRLRRDRARIAAGKSRHRGKYGFNTKTAEGKRLARIMALPTVKPVKHDAHVKTWLTWKKDQPTPKRNELHDAHIRLWKSDRARIERWKCAFIAGHRLNGRMRVAIRKALRGNKAGRKWESIVGYTLHDLKRHFDRMMPKGKRLDDVLRDGWHIDHIVPKSAYNLADERELAKAWCMSNLRLIPARENWSKRDNRVFLL